MRLISIIVPVYNSNVEFFKKTLDSIKNQTYKNWECTIVNDGTKNKDTLLFLDSLRKDSQFIIIDQENKGLGPARNTGIINSKGDFIVFLDADDWFSDNALETIAKNLNDDLDVLNYNFSYVYNDEIKLNSKYYIDFGNKRNWGIATSWSKACNRKFIIQNNIFYADSKLPHEDEPHWLLTCLFLKNYKSIDDSIVFYNKSNTSSITQSTPYKTSIESLIEYISMLSSTIKGVKPSPYFFEYVTKNITLFYLPIILLVSDNQSYKDYSKNYFRIHYLKKYFRFKYANIFSIIKFLTLMTIYSICFRWFFYILFKLLKPILKKILKDRTNEN